ncbi:hypothetical protein [Variovorax sp. J31P207]|uniref:hypothetical protein n=1 Tax=Variovorax sp. J31P207 TaxID=3053510 RepID=UPI002576A4F2|nr:hypothetical protein [Variovorax sp. J31P207]MDM0071753.1 hypothetical protein [Variovorax sp. J31P207]
MWQVNMLALTFCVGGAVLLWRDGSAYYLLARVGLLLCAWLVWRGRAAALSVSPVLLLGTVACSAWEVRFDWSQLLPRIDVWFGLAAWLLTPFVFCHLSAAGSHGGKLLWELWRPAPSWASSPSRRNTPRSRVHCPPAAKPPTRSVSDKTGKHYIGVMVGGRCSLGKPKSDTLLEYELPDRRTAWAAAVRSFRLL